MSDKADFDEVRQRLIDKKLGSLSSWDLPEIGYCVGPDNFYAFEDFQDRLIEVRDKLRKHIDNLSEEYLTEVITGSDAEKPGPSYLEWDDFLTREINQLHTDNPPAIAAGFGHPEFKADFEYWGSSPEFTLHEAVMLSVGAEPESISEDYIYELSKHSNPDTLWSAYRYIVRRHEQFSRFFPFGYEDYLPMRADAFKKRVEKLDIEIHPEFHGRLEKIWGTDDSRTKSEGASLTNQERTTLLKLIAAMACEQYKYDPNASRSAAASAIRDDLEEIGVTMDSKTIRKWLKEAMEQVDPEYWKK